MISSPGFLSIPFLKRQFSIKLEYNQIKQEAIIVQLMLRKCFPGSAVLKNPLDNAGDMGLIPGLGRSLEEEMAIHFSILAWEIPWTEVPGGLQSMGQKKSWT